MKRDTYIALLKTALKDQFIDVAMWMKKIEES